MLARRVVVSVPRCFSSVDEVIDGLAGLERDFVDARDRRGVFVTAYLVVTRILGDWLALGRFRREDLVSRYLVVFADAYRRALTRYEHPAGAGVPEAWKQAFDASRAGSISVLQDLLLGLNAHINFDLPHAVLEAGLDFECDACRRDHARIHEALRAATPPVRRRICSMYGSGSRVLGALFCRAVDHVIADTFERARRNAWAWAAALHAAPSTGERERLAKALDERAVRAGLRVLDARYAPVRCIRSLHRAEPATPAAQKSNWNRVIT